MLSFSEILSSLQLTACIIIVTLNVYNAPISATSSPSSSIYGQRDHYLLNCGLPPATTTLAFDNQPWRSDENSTFASLSALHGNTSATTAANPNPFAANQVPCASARIFNSPFTYSFPVSPGPKFIRLHFCPTTYGTTPASKFFLTLQAHGEGGPFTLLHNFSAYLHQDKSSSSSNPIKEEFLLNANTSRLHLTFFPTSPGSLAFINGIQIVSVPDHLYNGDDNPCAPLINVNNPTSQFSIPPVALQKMVRLNVGGADVAPDGDSGGMMREWTSDEAFLLRFKGAIPIRTPMKIKYTTSVPAYTAPEMVYWTARVMGPNNDTVQMTNNLTWVLMVDPGFDYLVRLHFCEIDSEITGVNQRMFNIYINNKTAQIGADVMVWAGVERSPVCKDYVVSAYGDGTGIDAASGSRVALWLTLRPDVEEHPVHLDAILNGLEVFKLSWNRSLAAPNPSSTADVLSANPRNTPGSGRSGSSNHHALIGVLSGIAFSLVIIFAICWFWIRRKAGRNNANEYSSLPSHLCKRFSLNQIKLATRNFEENMVIGVGGFGKVYKGFVPMDGEPATSITVAIKRLNPSSKQGAHEFRTEIEMLSRLRHVHLVSLIGYCNEGMEMILVYEYISQGTLRDHLYSRCKNQNPNPPLPWKERINICIGAARGLYHLHAGAKHPIIHRDVKSTNILLDEKWNAKVSDFGLCKVGPSGEDGGPNHVSTMVKGSIGYVDPEYHRLQQLTFKSDVYSFGVVLLEVLCARPAINPTLPKEQVNLAMWARSHIESGTLDTIIDTCLTDQIAPECLRKFGEVAEMCVRNNGIERPSMGDVVWGLEFALQLQLTAEKNEEINGVPGPGQGQGQVQGPVGGKIWSPANIQYAEVGDTVCDAIMYSSSTLTTTSDNNVDDHLGSGSVFSETMVPLGR